MSGVEQVPAEVERDAIVRYLLEEAEDAMTAITNFPESPEIVEMAVMRASYYRQAASFIKQGEQHRHDRPRPTPYTDFKLSDEGLVASSRLRLTDMCEAMEYWAGCDEGCSQDVASSEIMSSGGTWPAVAYEKARAELAKSQVPL